MHRLSFTMFTFAIICYILAIIPCIFLWLLTYESLSTLERWPRVVAFSALLCYSLGVVVGVIAEASRGKESFHQGMVISSSQVVAYAIYLFDVSCAVGFICPY